jgi:hypothetical protein
MWYFVPSTGFAGGNVRVEPVESRCFVSLAISLEFRVGQASLHDDLGFKGVDKLASHLLTDITATDDAELKYKRLSTLSGDR